MNHQVSPPSLPAPSASVAKKSKPKKKQNQNKKKKPSTSEEDAEKEEDVAAMDEDDDSEPSAEKEKEDDDDDEEWTGSSSSPSSSRSRIIASNPLNVTRYPSSLGFPLFRIPDLALHEPLMPPKPSKESIQQSKAQWNLLNSKREWKSISMTSLQEMNMDTEDKRLIALAYVHRFGLQFIPRWILETLSKSAEWKEKFVSFLVLPEKHKSERFGRKSNKLLDSLKEEQIVDLNAELSSFSSSANSATRFRYYHFTQKKNGKEVHGYIISGKPHVLLETLLYCYEIKKYQRETAKYLNRTRAPKGSGSKKQQQPKQQQQRKQRGRKKSRKQQSEEDEEEEAEAEAEENGDEAEEDAGDEDEREEEDEAEEEDEREEEDDAGEEEDDAGDEEEDEEEDAGDEREKEDASKQVDHLVYELNANEENSPDGGDLVFLNPSNHSNPANSDEEPTNELFPPTPVPSLLETDYNTTSTATAATATDVLIPCTPPPFSVPPPMTPSSYFSYGPSSEFHSFSPAAPAVASVVAPVDSVDTASAAAAASLDFTPRDTQEKIVIVLCSTIDCQREATQTRLFCGDHMNVCDDCANVLDLSFQKAAAKEADANSSSSSSSSLLCSSQ
jgi:hypothetical protein